jgi:hypothetical protein
MAFAEVLGATLAERSPSTPGPRGLCGPAAGPATRRPADHEDAPMKQNPTRPAVHESGSGALLAGERSAW